MFFVYEVEVISGCACVFEFFACEIKRVRRIGDCTRICGCFAPFVGTIIDIALIAKVNGSLIGGAEIEKRGFIGRRDLTRHIAAGLTASLGKIIDVYLHEIVDLGKVIVLPFFIGAIGIIVYGISIYMLSISRIAEFPFGEIVGIEYAVYSMIAGLFIAFVGVYVQSLVNRWIEKKGDRSGKPTFTS